MPSNYAEEVAALEASSTQKANVTEADQEPVDWLETVQPSGIGSYILSSISKGVANLTPSTASDQTSHFQDEDSTDNWEDAICPTFSDDENPQGAGECIFIARSVQRCVLEFFEEVAKDPTHYHNPVFEVATENGLEDNGWGGDEPSTDVSTEAELKVRKEELDQLKDALRNTPDKADLREGKTLLEKRIQRLEKEYQELSEKKPEAEVNGVRALPENVGSWDPVGRGPKVPVAGSMVDGELVKAVGMDDPAEDEDEMAVLDAAINGHE